MRSIGMNRGCRSFWSSAKKFAPCAAADVQDLDRFGERVDTGLAPVTKVSCGHDNSILRRVSSAILKPFSSRFNRKRGRLWEFMPPGH